MLVLLALLSVLVGQVRADLVAPSWRGTAGTTYADWDFTTAATTAAPETYTNAYGTPQANISLGYGASGYWTSYPPPSPLFSGGSPGIWDVGRGTQPGYSDGSITLTLPVSAGAAGGTTNIWVQAVYYAAIDGAPTVDVVGATEIPGTSNDSLLATLPSPWGSWHVSLTEWQLPSAQTSVQAVLTGNHEGTMFDSIVVDTQVVPEPASLTLLGLGTLALIVRRRAARRHSRG
jgi:hypothetical protein